MNNQLNDLKKRTFENGLSNNFFGALSFSSMKDKEPLTAKSAMTNATKARPSLGNSLTERLHRGTQASIKMGRRQVGGIPAGYEGYARDSMADMTPQPGYSANLGKRTFYQQMQEDQYYNYGSANKISYDETPGF